MANGGSFAMGQALAVRSDFTSGAVRRGRELVPEICTAG